MSDRFVPSRPAVALAGAALLAATVPAVAQAATAPTALSVTRTTATTTTTTATTTTATTTSAGVRFTPRPAVRTLAARTRQATTATSPAVTASPVTLDRLQTGLPITASTTLTGPARTTVTSLQVTATDAAGVRHDFPTVASATFSSAGTIAYAKARYLPAGTHALAVTFVDAQGTRRTLASGSATVWGVGAKSVVFPALAGSTSYPTTGQFAKGDWVAGRTSAFPWYAPGTTYQVNPGDHKLDCIDPAWSAPRADGTFEARRTSSGQCGGTAGLWATDLVTTRKADLSGFRMRTGDSLTATVTINDTRGGWPALWTWTDNGPTGAVGPGHGEVDLLENHDDTGQDLEFTNHASASGTAYCYPQSAYAVGRPFQLRVDADTDAVRFFVDGRQTCSLPGVAADWSAHLVVSLSVSDGTYHLAPTSAQTSMAPFKVTDLSVWR